MAGAEVNVTPGINTVNSLNSDCATKKFETLFSKNQNAKPIIMNPAMTLTFANTDTADLVLPRIFIKSSFTPLFL